MRNAPCPPSAQYSDASSLAMPASTSLRSPESLSRAALTISAGAASTLVAISASGKRSACAPAGAVAPQHPAAFHPPRKAPAGGAAEDVVGGGPVAVEDQLGGVDALVAHLVDLAGDGQAGEHLAEAGGLLDEER